MKVIAISDTHGQHRQVQLPPGDMLIHAGDVSVRGTESEVMDFLQWFDRQDFRYKIFIAGNHDFFFEQRSATEIEALIPDGVTYLNDSGLTTIEGIKVWGSPITPRFGDWAFNRNRGADIDQHWLKIPEDTDILVTHGPPKGILDYTIYGIKAGCEMLKIRIDEVQPKYCIFGHIHEAAGQVQKNNIHFINASVVNLQYFVVHLPTVFEIGG
ncbi:MAG: metallophosphatase domain-containing protein [Bacteroidota bacterium]